MAGAKRALSEMFPDQVVEMEEDDLMPRQEVKKNLMDMFVADTPMKGISSNLEPGQEHMKVYLRIRPLSAKELENKEDQNCIEVESEHVVSTHAPKDSHYFKTSTHGLGKTTHRFTFSKIFQETTSQKDFFDSTMLGMVKDFVDGQNCLVFSYGVTNAGKTYTIQGNPKDAGILPRALDVLFNSIEGKQWEGMNLKPKMFTDVVKLSPEQEAEERKVKEMVMKMSQDEDPDVMSLLGDDAGSDASRMTNTTASSESSLNGQHSQDSLGSLENLMEVENRVREETAVDVEVQGMVRFSIWVSFAEIYNEQIFDLLDHLPKKKNQKRTVLRLSEDKSGSPYIRGLKHINVRSADEAYNLMTIGQRNLRKACTNLNHNSSRSHCIFNIKVVRVVNKQNPSIARVSMLTLCDLAGSERYSKTQATGDRLKEAGNINTSLHTLGRCIEGLRYNQTHKENNRLIPFREGKLTRLFQNFFCGKGKAAMIVNVNKCASMFDETFHVFKFSAIAKQLVVVQKPEPKPKNPQPKCSAKRSSIAWACPPHQELQSKTSLAISVPLPTTSDDDLDESYSEIQVLHEVIAELKSRLTKERDERAMDELRIREEVCKEMMSQIVRIEAVYSERLKEQQAIHEERLEKKIELLKSCHPKDRKGSCDRMEDEEDDWVSSMLLHAEKTKVEARDKKIAELEAELIQTKERLKAEVSMREDSIKAADEEDLSQRSLVDTMSQQLEKTRDQLEQKETEIQELNETLSEAAETFMQKETEIRKLREELKADDEKLKQQEETMRELQKLLDESKGALEAANEKLTSRDIQILDLQTGYEELQEQLETIGKDKKASDIEKGNLGAKLLEMEAELQPLRDSLKMKIEELTHLTDQLNSNQKLQSDLKSSQNLIVEKEKLLDDVKKSRDSLQEQVSEKDEKIMSLQTALEAFEKEIKELTSGKESQCELEQELKSANSRILELEKSLDTLTGERDVIHVKLQEKEKEIMTLKETSRNTKVEDEIQVGKFQKLETDCKSLQDTLAEKDKFIHDVKKERNVLQDKLVEKDQEILHLQTAVAAKAKEVEELYRKNANRGELEKILQSVRNEVVEKTKAIEKITSDKDMLHAQLIQKEQEVQKLKESAEANSKSLHDLQVRCAKDQEFESEINSWKWRVSEAEKLVEKITQDKSLVESTLSEKEEKLLAVQEDLESKKKELSELHSKQKLMLTDLRVLESKVANGDKRLSEMTKERDSLRDLNQEPEIMFKYSCDNKHLAVTDLHGGYSEMAGTVDQQAALIKELNVKLEQSDGEIRRLEQLVKQKDESLQAVEKIQREISVEKKDLEVLKGKIEAKEEEILRLNEETQKMITGLKCELEKEKRHSKDLTDTMCEKETKIQNLLETLRQKDVALESLSKVEADLKSEKADLLDLRHKVESKEEELLNVKDWINKEEQHANRIRELGTELEAKNHRIDELEELLDAQTKVEDEDEISFPKQNAEEIERLTKKITKLEAEIVVRKQNFLQQEETLGAKEREVIKLKTRITREQEDFSQRELALIHGYTAEIENYKAQIANLKATGKKDAFREENEVQKSLESYKQAMEENENFKKDLLKQLKELQLQLDQKSSTIAEMEQTMDITKSATADLEARLEAEVEGHNTAKIRIDELKKELKNIRNSVRRLSEIKKKEKADLEEDMAKIRGEVALKGVEIGSLKDENEELKSQLADKCSHDNSQLSPEPYADKIASCINDSVVEFRFHEVTFRVEELQQENTELKKETKLLKEKCKEESDELENVKKQNENLSQRLTTVNEEMMKTKADLEGEIEKLKKEGTLLHENLERKEKNFCEVEEKLKVTLQKVNEQMASLETAEAEIQKLSDEVEELQTVNSGLRKMVDEVTIELQNKDKKITELTTHTSDVKPLQATVHSGKEIVKELTNQLQICNKEKDVAMSECEKLQASLKEKEKTLTYETEKLEEKTTLIEKFSTESASKTATICSLEAINGELKQELDQEKSLLLSKNSEIQNLLASVKEMDSEIDYLKKKVSTLESNTEDLAQKLSSSSDSVLVKEGLVGELEKQIADLTADVNQKDEMVVKLKDEVKMLREEVMEKNKCVGGKMEELTECVDKKNKEIDNLQKELEDSARRANVKSKDIEKLKEWEERVAELSEEVTEKRNCVEKLEETLRELKNDIEVKCKEMASLAVRNSTLQADLDASIKKVNKLEKELSGVNGELQERCLTVTDLEKKIADLSESSKATEAKLREDLEAVCQELEKVKTKLFDSNSEMADFKSLQENLERKWRNEGAEKDVKLSKMEETVVKLKNEIKTLHEEIQEKNKSVEGQAAELTESIDKKNKKIDYLQEEVEEAARRADVRSKDIEKLEKEWEEKVAKLSEEVTERRDHIEKLKETLSELKNDIEVICVEKKSLEETNSTLQADLDANVKKVNKLAKELSEVKEEREDRSGTVTDLEKKIGELSAAEVKLSEELETAHQELEKVKTHLSDSSSKVAHYKSLQENLETKLAEKDVELCECKKNREEDRAAVEKLQVDVACKQSIVKSQKDEIDRLSTELEEQVKLFQQSNEELEKLHGLVMEKDTNIECLGTKVASLQTDVDELVTKLDKSVESSTEKSDLISKLEAESKALSETVTAKENLIVKLKTEMKILNETVSNENKTTRGEVARLTESLSQKNEELEKLQQNLSKMQDEFEVKSEIAAQFAEEIKHLKNSVDGKKAKVMELEKAIELKEESISKMELQLKDVSDEVRHKNNAVESLEEELASLKKSALSDADKMEEMETTTKVLKQDNEAKSERLEEMEKEMKKLITEGIEKWEKIVKLETELAEFADQDAKQAEKIVAKVESPLVASRLSCDSSEVDDLKRKLEEKQAEMEQLWAFIGEKETENDALTDEIEEFKSMSEELKKQIQEKDILLSSKQFTNGELQQKLAEKEEESSGISSAGRLSYKSMSDKVEKLNNLLEEKTLCEKELNQKLNEKNREIKELENDVSELKAKLEGLSSEQNSESLLQVLEKEKSNLQQQLNEAAEKIMNGESTISNLKCRIAELEFEVSLSQDNSSHSVTRSLRRQKIEAEKSKFEAECALNEALQEMDILRKKMKDLQSSTGVCSTEHSLNSSNRQTRVSNSDCSEIHSLKSENARLAKLVEEKDKHNRRCLTEVGQYQSKLEKTEEELGKLRQKVEENGNQESSGVTNKSRITALQNQMEGLNEEITKLREKVYDLETELDAKKSSVEDLTAQMEKEKAACKEAEEAVKEKDKVIEELKKWLDVQEDTMNKQDRIISERDEQISVLQEEVDELTERCERHSKKDSSTSHQMKEMSRSRTKLESENDAYAAELTEMENVIRELRVDKDKLVLAVSEKCDEIKDLQKSLADAQSEVKSMSLHLAQVTKSQNSTQSHLDDQKTLSDLKKKIKEKDVTIKLLEKEVSNLQTEVANIATKKDEELQVWRANRDQLVGSLEALMKKQAKEIKELREEKGGNSGKDNNKDLVKKLLERDEKIVALEEHIERLEQAHKVLAAASTRGRRKFSQLAPDEQQELEVLRKQYEHEREQKILVQKQLNTVQKAKDQIITDLKESNSELQGQIATLQGASVRYPGSSSHSSLTDCDTSSRERSDGIPGAKPKKRGRKRGSSENVPQPTEPEGSSGKVKKGRGKASKSSVSAENDTSQSSYMGSSGKVKKGRGKSSKSSVSAEDDTSHSSVKDEGDSVSSRPSRCSKRKAMSRMEEMMTNVQNSSTKEVMNQEMRSPEVKAVTQEAKDSRRKRRLYKPDTSELFDPALFMRSADPNPARIDVHEVVHRRLRERR